MYTAATRQFAIPFLRSLREVFTGELLPETDQFNTAWGVVARQTHEISDIPDLNPIPDPYTGRFSAASDVILEGVQRGVLGLNHDMTGAYFLEQEDLDGRVSTNYDTLAQVFVTAYTGGTEPQAP